MPENSKPNFCYACGQIITAPEKAKCEICGIEATAKPFPAGWDQRGKSKYGNQYHRKGVAWYCPKCKVMPKTA